MKNNKSDGFNDAKLKLVYAKSILLMMSSYHQSGLKNLFESDIDNVASAVYELVSDAEKVL